MPQPKPGRDLQQSQAEIGLAFIEAPLRNPGAGASDKLALELSRAAPFQMRSIALLHGWPPSR
jgi:hypothetical protein